MKAATLLLLLAIPLSARAADVTWFPTSHHQLYLTNGLFLDQQTMLAARDSGRAWGSLGGAFAVAQLNDWASHPQLVFHGTIDTSFRVLGAPLDVRAETFDARLGFSVDIAYRPNLRFLVDFTHLSGHAADGVLNLSLFPPNLGRDILQLRVIYDHENHFRLGGTLTPVISSDPPAKFFGANQFAEWFPWGAKDSTTAPTPYLAGSLEEYGAEQIDLSLNVQLGIYYGSHLKAESGSMLRFLIGWYHGVDPRLKVAQFLGSKVSFPYLGIALNI